MSLTDSVLEAQDFIFISSICSRLLQQPETVREGDRQSNGELLKWRPIPYNGRACQALPILQIMIIEIWHLHVTLEAGLQLIALKLCSKMVELAA